MFYYSGFGMNIASEIHFQELLPIDKPENVQLTIKKGVTVKSLDNSALIRPNLWITTNQYLLHIEGYGYYYAENGNLIIVESYQDYDLKGMRLYLLANAMAAILIQRKLIPLHASAFLTSNGIVLIVGESGAGKSTTLQAFLRKGYSIFTDDICVLKYDKKRILGIPSYPIMKLWTSTLNLLEMNDVIEENRLWPELDKYGISFHDQFSSTWEPIWKIFVLEIDPDIEEPLSEKLRGVASFLKIGANTYGKNYIEPIKANADHFDIITELVKQCEVYRIVRPATGNSLSEVTAAIENRLH